MDLSPVWISLKTSVVSIIITFFLGLWAARGVVSVRSTKAKAWLDGLLTLPLVLPPTVAGFFLLYLFGAKRPAGIFLEKVFHYKIVFSWQATVLAAVVISFPLMYRSARGAIEQVDANLIYAGRTLGMSERTISGNYFATGKTGNPLRRRARIHKRARRIRSDCDDRRKYCRKNKDTATRHLF